MSASSLSLYGSLLLLITSKMLGQLLIAILISNCRLVNTQKLVPVPAYDSEDSLLVLVPLWPQKATCQ